MLATLFAALLAGAAFVLGAWIGHAGAWREATRRHLRMRVRVRVREHVLIDGTVEELALLHRLVALELDAGEAVPDCLELNVAAADL